MKVTITRLGHLGDGIAEGPLFVPRTLPGEVIEGEADGQSLIEPRIVTPSRDRVRPPCPHYRTCGGCALQHASDVFVAEWKQDVVRTALSAQGIEAQFRPIQTSPPRSRRRATLAARRTKKGVILGFHGRASDSLVAVPDCHLLHHDIAAAFPALEEIAALGASRKSEITLTVARSDSGSDVAVGGGKPIDAALRQDLASIAERFGLSRIAWDGETVVLRQPPAQRFGVARVVPPPGAFLQATAEGEAALLAAVVEAVGPARRVADLFAGCGTFSLPLAQHAEVHAVESDAPMLAALDKGWRQAEGLRHVTTENRDLFRRPLMAEDLRRYDAAVLDPPRAGAEAQVTQLAAASVPRLAMVSCNPVTFARDLRILAQAGYRIDWVQVVDQFRWSAHIEVVAQLSRGSGKGS